MSKARHCRACGSFARGAGRTLRTFPRKIHVDLGAVREWARANGHTVGDWGRVPGTVDAYQAAPARYEVRGSGRMSAHGNGGVSDEGRPTPPLSESRLVDVERECFALEIVAEDGRSG